MTTVSTPHSVNQFTSRCRSAVKVPKLRTGSGVHSALTAAVCMVAPISIAAAFLCTSGIARSIFLVDLLPPIPIPPAVGWKGWAALLINFLNGIAERRHHSQVRNNPWTMLYDGELATNRASAAPFRPQNSLDRFYANRQDRSPRRLYMKSRRAMSQPSRPRRLGFPPRRLIG